MATHKPTFKPRAGGNIARTIKLRPAAWATLCELQDEYSQHYGRVINKTEIIEAALTLITRLENHGAALETSANAGS